jgi:serine/threonine protein kinase
MEYSPFGNLATEILRRKSINEPWRDDTLMAFIQATVHTLALAQERDICHGNLRPSNFFLQQDGDFLIGGFGQFTRNHHKSVKSGMTCYLSPILCSAYELARQQGEALTRYDNPYKSDVFSLGVMLAYMAVLNPPAGSMMSKDPSAISKKLADIRFYRSAEVSNIIESMLQFEEDARPDFLELRETVGAGTAQGKVMLGEIRPEYHFVAKPAVSEETKEETPVTETGRIKLSD